MSRLHNLYTQLVTNRRSELEGWLRAYRNFTKDVGQVRLALAQGGQLSDKQTYENTRWKADSDPWQEFSSDLLRRPNGVTTVGRSVLAKDNLKRLCGDGAYLEALKGLILAPSTASFQAFEEAWEDACQRLQIGRNPLLLNRTAAACTLEVSSTVNNADFESVYAWLIAQKLLPAEAGQVRGWYARNCYLMKHLHTEFAQLLASGTTDPHTLSSFVWELCANIASPFQLKKQLIRYGAPGTGKTYSALRDSRLRFDIWKSEFGAGATLSHEQCCQTVQFHPSYGYEDFLEGLRPVLRADGTSQLVLQNGIFKQLCIAAGLWERDVYRIPVDGPELCRRWPTLSIGDLKKYRDWLTADYWTPLFAHGDAGCLLADAVPPFFLIIDEINRAELSRVLGELMVCLEYRGPLHAIATQYAQLNSADTGMLQTATQDYRFFVPHNVFIIGTMNTIDRSIESFDLALRRRFAWQRVDPDLNLLRYHLDNEGKGRAGLADSLKHLNSKIRAHPQLGEDYQIGHAYLMNLPYSPQLTLSELRQRIWDDSIGPLLEEYLRGLDKGQLAMFAQAFGVR
jgi:5-methylcytosine-specific restriction protein B